MAPEQKKETEKRLPLGRRARRAWTQGFPRLLRIWAVRPRILLGRSRYRRNRRQRGFGRRDIDKSETIW